MKRALALHCTPHFYGTLCPAEARRGAGAGSQVSVRQLCRAQTWGRGAVAALAVGSGPADESGRPRVAAPAGQVLAVDLLGSVTALRCVAGPRGGALLVPCAVDRRPLFVQVGLAL
jgi:hypothetical protein